MTKHFKVALYLVLAIGFSSAFAGSRDDFFIALNRDDGGWVARLLKQGFDPNTLDDKGRTALGFALLNDSMRAAEALMESPTLDVNRLNTAGESALMIAALRGNLDWVKRLLARGAQVNHDGWSALHYAASGPNPEVVDLLIRQGANIEGRSPNGTTPLMMAARYGSEPNVDRLLAAKAEIRASNEQGLTAVDFARLGGREPLTKRLDQLMPR
ncbi:MAG: ankyrin repeat domain-containing protein [Ideonella sp.]|nr:ankyrin repeat domain-containing protein [Ideonella sp.]